MLESQEASKLFFVKTDYHSVADVNHRHSHLAALLYHFLALREVGRDVVIRESDFVRCKEILSRVAEVTRRRAVYSDLCLCRHICHALIG